MTDRIHLLGLSCLMAALLSGCGADEAASDINTNINNTSGAQCRADAECGATLRCEQGICISPTDAPRSLSFAFLPPPSSGYLPQRLDGLELYPGELLNFSLEPSVQVDGDVSVLDRVSGNAQVLTSGTLLFERRGDRDAQLIRQVRLTEPRFEVKVRPGTYTISYLPAEPGQLGWRWEEQQIQTHATLALTLPEQGKTAITVEGKLTHRDGLLGEMLPAVGVSGVSVAAIQQKTGLSSTVVQTNEVGEFRLLVWPNSGPYDLHIQPSEPNSLAPRAVLTSAFTAGRDPITLDAELGAYPNLGRAVSVMIVLSPDTLGALDVAPGELTITTRAAIKEGELIVSRRLGEDGELELPLLPMRYSLTISPPRTSRFGELELSIDLTSPNVELAAAVLPERRRVSGTLTTASGQPAKRAKLLVYEERSSSARGKIAEAATFTADDEGRFEVWVDPGERTRWELVPEGSQQAPRGAYTLEPGDDDIAQLQLALPAPATLTGSVRGIDLEALPDVVVQVIELLDGAERIIAEGTTDRGGKFKLLVSGAD